MIVAERPPRIEERNPEAFGSEMPDGRMTEPSRDVTYRLREAIRESRRLGRELTEEELASFVDA